jgi:hypothetical protein
MKKFALLSLLLITFDAHAAVNVLGRLGVGFTNQMANEVESISFKIQRSRSSALGVILGFQSRDGETSYGLGVKLYRNIYEEPNLRFYMAGMLASLSQIVTVNGNPETQSGMQIDGTFGTEFHINSIESLGFSMEFGISTNTLGNDTTIETIGDGFIKAALHFYL